MIATYLIVAVFKAFSWGLAGTLEQITTSPQMSNTEPLQSSYMYLQSDSQPELQPALSYKALTWPVRDLEVK